MIGSIFSVRKTKAEVSLKRHNSSWSVRLGVKCMRSSRNGWIASRAMPCNSSLANAPPPMHYFQLSFIGRADNEEWSHLLQKNLSLVYLVTKYNSFFFKSLHKNFSPSQNLKDFFVSINFFLEKNCIHLEITFFIFILF